MMIEYQFMIYLNNVELLRARLTTTVEGLIGGLFTDYAMKVKQYQEDQFQQDNQDVEADEYM